MYRDVLMNASRLPFPALRTKGPQEKAAAGSVPRSSRGAGIRCLFQGPARKGHRGTRFEAAHGNTGPAESRPGSAACLRAPGPFTWQDPAAGIPRRSPFRGCCRIPGRAREASSSIPPSDLSELLAPAIRPCGSRAGAGADAAPRRRVSGTASAGGARAGRPAEGTGGF